MNLKGDYDSELQMFADRAREPDRAHLRFLRWLAERSWLEHEPIGPPVGAYRLATLADSLTSADRSMMPRRRPLQGATAAGAALALAPTLFSTGALARARAPILPKQTPGYDPGQSFEVQVSDLAYRQAGRQSWLARVYQPQGDGPFPALLEIHGGVWTDNDRTYDEPISRVLAASGLVVVAIDFRQGPADPYPSSLADINYATRWLKAHAADFNADPHTVGGFGGSSGGHLIVLSAMCPRDPRYAELPLAEAPEVDATLAYVVAHCPVIDPAARYDFAQQVGRADLVSKQDGYFRTRETMEEANPPRILQRREEAELPPTLVLHGTADLNVPIVHVEDFAAAYRAASLQRLLKAAASPSDAAAAYRAAGGALELAEFPGMPHYFLHPTSATGPQADGGLQLIKEFIARQVAGPTAVSENRPSY
jgi:acetyl esterase/lipase